MPAHSPAAERNRVPILAELQRLLPARGTALEIAAGTGQHAEHFAAALPGWTWLPSDAEAAALPHIDARCRSLPNVSPALHLDVRVQPWAGVPAVLVPLIVSTTAHQRDNAAWMAAQGAAIHLPQAELSAAKLAELLRTLDRATLLAMADKARALARPQAAARVADEIEKLARRAA